MDKIKQLQVLYEGRTVGTMALYRKHLAAFQYSEEWIADGFSISPFSLPLGKKVFVPQILPFDGIFGVFEDSLPDGWGRLLVDRQLLKHNINPIERKAWIGLRSSEAWAWAHCNMCRNSTLRRKRR